MRVLKSVRGPAITMLAVALGCVLGAALVAPNASTAVTYSYRFASCSGLEFLPADTDATSTYSGTVRYGDANPALQTRLTCDPHLPHGAIVTKVEFTLYDNDNSSQFGTLYCHLARNGTGTTTFTSDAQELAAVVTSGSPGVTRLSDDTIPTDYATVNAMTKAYWLYCDFFYGSGKPATALGVFGADVYFKITPAKG